MLIATGPLLEFAQFLRIVSWILLPVLFMAVIVTVFIHYRRRKKNSGASSEKDEPLLLTSPAEMTSNRREGVHVLFDHTGLIKQYRNKLSYNHARYAALKQDFEKLEMKYAAAVGTEPNLSHSKKSDMQQTLEQMQTAIDLMADHHSKEKKQLAERIEQLDRSYKDLETEHSSLLEQVRSGNSDALILKWKEENSELKARISEQGYLKNLLEEKKNQIAFLQEQAEQRIIQQYEIERTYEENKNEVLSLRDKNESFSSEINGIKNDLVQKQNELDRLTIMISEKEAETGEMQQLLSSSQDQITYLNNVLSELKEQNELLSATASDSQDLLGNLREQLKEEESKALHAEEKLAANKQMLRRLNRVITECAGEADEETVVVELKPVFAR